ncbi:hypothetical protein SAMD00019534_078920 [Acytostelium subglobosum LB1]|uniref:hypothetical protein n=1 Tax=Acytostelium subglobosum LB1 TaxID=1410327 RepID=UPI000644A942|nr:hypothetical protein SAMD00019534_078920 [Acytostelium subglobosum LB1]GAM24717.1 hypothetical protein SAMD00019534_078920 [Acytostelium subglobosum LB1]|eukprot:XP_012752386.1 hypothetical protein SAMD00019534_078920 [Acytostelium subglobosum LB1]
MMEEQKLKKELDDELDKTTTSINNIINEIANLNARQYLFIKELRERILQTESHLSYWKDSCSMYSLDTGEWTVINDKCTPRERIFNSVVYARDSVYVFGGEGSPNTYSRFSLIDQKWHNDLEIIGVDGGESISTCYDGDNLIYLVGGCNDDIVLNRVDCFNIDTQQFSTVGRLSVATRGSYSFVRRNKIFVVGGHVDVYCDTSLTEVLSFYTQTKKCFVHCETEFNTNESLLTCYNGIDQVYITVNLCAKNSLQHSQLYLSEDDDGDNPFIFTQSHGFVSLCGGANSIRYSVLQDKWISLNGNDPVDSRENFGSCHIYH